MKKTIGGDRLGSGKKMKVDLHGYERSTHNMGYLWRSTMSAGTLVPFLKEVALPGDTFDIELDCDIKTHPTIGPLFGSYKVQLDIFLCPLRLYQGKLHNNKLGIGLRMNEIFLPKLQLSSVMIDSTAPPRDLDNSSTNPSSIFAYLGLRGAGKQIDDVSAVFRDFNAVPWLAYWDIYKNYYANKQEEIGAVIHTPRPAIVETVDDIQINFILAQAPGVTPQNCTISSQMTINYTGARPDLSTIIINFTGRGDISVLESWNELSDVGGQIVLQYDHADLGDDTATNWRYAQPTDVLYGEIDITTFPLENIDRMREEIMAYTTVPTAFDVNTQNYAPYNLVLDNEQPALLSSQEGLALKTYQSDLFNNWLETEWIDGTNGINEITAIDTSGGSFTIDTLNLSRKVYDMLNRIAVSGGSYDDWLDAVYTHDRYTRCESPMYMGGLIKELVFQEVVSNAEGGGDNGTQPLGTLAGKGVLGKKHKGGHVVVKVDEPGYLMGIISLTPRIDYSQGNDWDVHLSTMDDLHKPALDEIGFQELLIEQMAWWDTEWNGSEWVTRSAGKQPAWINYMTKVNQVRGNFAIESNEMFMTLNRKYTPNGTTFNVEDVTTYIDPSKFNSIFAQTSLDAQNFWAQIAVDMTARRKMSAKIMPNL